MMLSMPCLVLQLKILPSVPLPLPPQLGWEGAEEKKVTAK